LRHVPNILTLLRVLSVPVTVWLIVEGRMSTAFWLFTFAGATDAVDGAVARLFNARTKLGQWMDPLADKLLLVATYITLGTGGELPLWLAVLVVVRDVVILFYVFVYLLAGAFSVRPILISKINTVAQIALVAIVLARLGLAWGGPMLTEAFIYVVAATTTASGAAYLFSASRRQPAARP